MEKSSIKRVTDRQNIKGLVEIHPHYPTLWRIDVPRDHSCSVHAFRLIYKASTGKRLKSCTQMRCHLTRLMEQNGITNQDYLEKLKHPQRWLSSYELAILFDSINMNMAEIIEQPNDQGEYIYTLQRVSSIPGRPYALLENQQIPENEHYMLLVKRTTDNGWDSEAEYLEYQFSEEDLEALGYPSNSDHHFINTKKILMSVILMNAEETTEINTTMENTTENVLKKRKINNSTPSSSQTQQSLLEACENNLKKVKRMYNTYKLDNTRLLSRIEELTNELKALKVAKGMNTENRISCNTHHPVLSNIFGENEQIESELEQLYEIDNENDLHYSETENHWQTDVDAIEGNNREFIVISDDDDDEYDLKDDNR